MSWRGVTMAGHYQKNALDQKKEADRWRLATVAVGIAAVIAAIALLVSGIFYRDNLQWADYVSHAGITVAIGGLATFLGNQSLRHRRREEQYRALKLELATLDPFLSSVNEDERFRIKAQLATRYFVGIDPNVAHS